MTVPSQPLLPTELPDPGPPAVQPPRGFALLALLACVGAGAAQMSAALLTLPLKANQLDAGTAATTISLSTSIAGILTLIALPVVGTLSDRSRARMGRRRPFLLLAAIAFVAGGALLVAAPDLPTFVAAHLLITLGFVSATVTCIALVADQLPVDRRGPTAALIGIGTPLGALVGMAVAVPFGDDLVPLVGIPTAVAVVFPLLLAVAVRDVRPQSAPPAFDLRRFVSVFWVNPLKHPDFTWVFTSRMLVFSGVAALNIFLALYLMQHLQVEPARLSVAILLTVVVNAGVTLLAAPAVGKLSDRLGRRKPFIVAAALIFAAGLLLAARASTFAEYVVACGVVGLGQGVYFAVELVLATQVLPDPENPAKDLGILKIADNLPSTFVAALAPALLAIGGGGNYAALFVAGACAAVLGGLVISLVRGAR
ncbi:MFS transporter [Kineococcus sp. LSe6-4]|uniref:MFS transporter n=1 Tax=Kineococcus halophytocola TaxID=3234027 RepID=A0ABV4H4A5_9ACTN